MFHYVIFKNTKEYCNWFKACCVNKEKVLSIPLEGYKFIEMLQDRRQMTALFFKRGREENDKRLDIELGQPYNLTPHFKENVLNVG